MRRETVDHFVADWSRRLTTARVFNKTDISDRGVLFARKHALNRRRTDDLAFCAQRKKKCARSYALFKILYPNERVVSRANVRKVAVAVIITYTLCYT